MSDHDPSQAQFGTTLVDVTRLFRREFDRRAAHLGLTRAQWRVLKLVGQEERLSQKDLAERLEMDPIAVGRTVDRLQKSGFIERRADPGDRRVWRLHPAPTSSAVMGGVERISSDLRDEVLGAIDPADLATTVRVLGTVEGMSTFYGTTFRVEATLESPTDATYVFRWRD